MSTILSLGIKDPMIRTIIWLFGCGTLSVVGSIAGFAAVACLATAYCAGVKLMLSMR